MNLTVPVDPSSDLSVRWGYTRWRHTDVVDDTPFLLMWWRHYVRSRQRLQNSTGLSTERFLEMEATYGQKAMRKMAIKAPALRPLVARSSSVPLEEVAAIVKTALPEAFHRYVDELEEMKWNVSRIVEENLVVSLRLPADSSHEGQKMELGLLPQSMAPDRYSKQAQAFMRECIGFAVEKKPSDHRSTDHVSVPMATVRAKAGESMLYELDWHIVELAGSLRRFRRALSVLLPDVQTQLAQWKDC